MVPLATAGLGLAAAACGGPIVVTQTGCLVTGGPAASTRSAPARTAAPGAHIAAQSSAVTVTHRLRHLCCLKARVKVTRAAGRITIDESLYGKPCRCLCGSTIRARVRTPPGRTVVVVRLRRRQGPPKVVTTHPVRVPR